MGWKAGREGQGEGEGEEEVVRRCIPSTSLENLSNTSSTRSLELMSSLLRACLSASMETLGTKCVPMPQYIASSTLILFPILFRQLGGKEGKEEERDIRADGKRQTYQLVQDKDQFYQDILPKNEYPQHL